MNKSRNNDLICIANQAIQTVDKLFKEKTSVIKEFYNGQTAALGVSVAMTGLLPTLAMYYKESKNEDKRPILDVIGKMIELDKEQEPEISEFPGVRDARSLLKFAINKDNKDRLPLLAKEVEECSVALKQVIRTYKLG